jgi:small-conductance mechanosensitive channel
MTIGVSYDSDIEKAKKLIKDIGKQLAADAEFAAHVIEPLKMQGVEQFGDHAIQLRLKMMTKPNEQFVMRRRALAMIKKASTRTASGSRLRRCRYRVGMPRRQQPRCPS